MLLNKTADRTISHSPLHIQWLSRPEFLILQSCDRALEGQRWWQCDKTIVHNRRICVEKSDTEGKCFGIVYLDLKVKDNGWPKNCCKYISNFKAVTTVFHSTLYKSDIALVFDDKYKSYNVKKITKVTLIEYIISMFQSFIQTIYDLYISICKHTN